MTCSVCNPESSHSQKVRICASCLDRLVSLGCYAQDGDVADYDQESYWLAISDEMEFLGSVVQMAMQLEEKFEINFQGDMSGDWWLAPPNTEKTASVTMSYGCGEPDGHIRPMLDAVYHEILRQSS